ncbi:MAG: DUF1064 domain-containing protein [Lutibacter sp.]
MTVDQFRKIKPHKYNAKKILVNGIKFDSKKEAQHYLKLKLLLDNGVIKNLVLQPLYTFKHNGQFIGRYKPDFEFWDVPEMKKRVVDVKGCKFGLPYAKFKSQCRLMKAFYNIEVEEV